MGSALPQLSFQGDHDPAQPAPVFNQRTLDESAFVLSTYSREQQDVIIGGVIQQAMEKYNLPEPPASIVAYAAAICERIHQLEQQGGTA